MGDNLPALFLPPAGIISGTVTDSVTGLPVANTSVAVLRTSDFGAAASALTDGAGNYATSVPTGTYYLYRLNYSGTYADGFHGAPTTVTVTDGATNDVDPTMVPLRGSFSGTVTDQATGAALAGVAVYAIGPNGLVGGTSTSGGGTYTLANLPVGTYRAVFLDQRGRRLAEYWNNSPDFAGATPFNVTAGTTTPNISAALFKP
jgi:hypothetical protein